MQKKEIRLDKFRRLFDWFSKARSKNIPISGPVLEAQGKAIAEHLKISNGWLDSFRKKYEIKYGKICGETSDVCETTVDDWKKRIIEEIKGYE